MARIASYLAAFVSAGTVIGLLVIAVLISGGCTAAPKVKVSRYHTDADVSPWTRDAQRGRSLVFDGGRAADAGARWYDARNDAGPEVFGGYETATISTVRTSTRHHARVHNGRVRDDTHDRTHRESVRITVR